MIAATEAFTGRSVRIQWSGEFITRIDPVDRAETPPDVWVAPALFDVQINGGLGVDFSDPATTPEDTHRVADWLGANGVSGFLATVITGPPDRIAAALRNLHRIIEAEPVLGRMIPGFHLEGPTISPQDGTRGAHPAEHCREPDWGEFCQFQDAAGGRIRLVTLAPEWPGAAAFTKRLVQTGVRVAIGHTAATAPQIDAVVTAGATLSTHLGNGLTRTIDRHHNPLWPQLADDRLAASVIADGAHLPDEMLRCIARLKPGRLIATCDASPLAGLPPGDYRLWGQAVRIDAHGVPRIRGTGYLAGSGRAPGDCLAHLARCAGLTLVETLTAGCVLPRTLLGLPVPGLQVGAWVSEFRLFGSPIAGTPVVRSLV